MPRLIHIEPHLTEEELRQRYRSSTDVVESRHFQVVWLAAKGYPAHQIAEVTDYGRDWVFRIVQRYNAGGPKAMADERHEHAGGRYLLTAEQQKALSERLTSPPDDGGRWTGAKVAAWMALVLGEPVHEQRGYEYLHRLGYTLQRPRPASARADEAAQQDFKKKRLRSRSPP